MGLEQHEGYRDARHFATDVMEALQGATLDLTQPVPLTFYLYLPTLVAAQTCAEWLRADGFEMEDPEESEGTWSCVSDLALVPSVEALELIGEKLMTLATEHGGDFDGWETNPYKVPGGVEDLLRQMIQEAENNDNDE